MASSTHKMVTRATTCLSSFEGTPWESTFKNLAKEHPHLATLASTTIKEMTAFDPTLLNGVGQYQLTLPLIYLGHYYTFFPDGSLVITPFNNIDWRVMFGEVFRAGLLRVNILSTIVTLNVAACERAGGKDLFRFSSWIRSTEPMTHSWE